MFNGLEDLRIDKVRTSYDGQIAGRPRGSRRLWLGTRHPRPQPSLNLQASGPRGRIQTTGAASPPRFAARTVVRPRRVVQGHDLLDGKAAPRENLGELGRRVLVMMAGKRGSVS